MLITSSCNSIEDTPGGFNTLQVKVTNTAPESRAIITGTTLPVDAAIGVTLLDAAGQNYDNTPYSNLKYTTANGIDWAISGADAPLLTATDGKAIAYYPWKDGADYTALAVETASQTDYMYSGWVEGINNSAPEASFQMEHGLSAFRVILKKDANYLADATATTVNVKSDAFVASATMSAVDGTLSAWTGNGDVTVDMDDITLSTTDQYTDIMVVPAEAAGTEATFTVAVTDANSNSKNYTVDVPFTTAMLQGKCYQFTLTLTATGFEVSTVAVTEWGQVQDAGSGSLAPKLPIVGTIDLKTAANGVYAVAKNGKGVTVGDADESCIAVALIVNDAPTPQKFMIEKNEYNNTAWNGDKTYPKGYIPKQAVEIYGSYALYDNANYKTWTNVHYLSSYFNGKEMTEACAGADYSTIGLLDRFNSSSYADENLGYNDWYIPATGQWALIYLYIDEIQFCIEKIGGVSINADTQYVTSTNSYLGQGFVINFDNGETYWGDNFSDSYLSTRLIRDIDTNTEYKTYYAISIDTKDWYCHFDRNMTWEQYINSSYYTNSSWSTEGTLSVDGEYIKFEDKRDSSVKYVCTYNGLRVNKNDIIYDFKDNSYTVKE